MLNEVRASDGREGMAEGQAPTGRPGGPRNDGGGNIRSPRGHVKGAPRSGPRVDRGFGWRSGGVDRGLGRAPWSGAWDGWPEKSEPRSNVWIAMIGRRDTLILYKVGFQVRIPNLRAF